MKREHLIVVVSLGQLLNPVGACRYRRPRTTVMLPTEPIGSIPRPAALIEAVQGFRAQRGPRRHVPLRPARDAMRSERR
jgi:hypothetical protein